jgi:hypothetical protein
MPAFRERLLSDEQRRMSTAAFVSMSTARFLHASQRALLKAVLYDLRWYPWEIMKESTKSAKADLEKYGPANGSPMVRRLR